MIKKAKYVYLLAVILSSMVGCQGFVQSIKDTFNDPAVAAPTVDGAIGVNDVVGGFLLDSVALQQAEDALRKLPQFVGKTINVYESIHFYDDGRIMLQLQHPDNPEYVDQYRYRGGAWQSPEPVQLSVRDEVSASLVGLDEVPFHVAARVTHHLHDKANELVGAEPATHTYLIINRGKITWYPISIDGDRERYRITFHSDGSIQSYERQ